MNYYKYTYKNSTFKQERMCPHMHWELILVHCKGRVIEVGKFQEKAICEKLYSRILGYRKYDYEKNGGVKKISGIYTQG